MPAFDLRETAKEFLICADVPGIKVDLIITNLLFFAFST